jgi:hypothetical protein
LDGEVVKTGNLERFEFTWEGQDENDPAFRSGWQKLSGKDKSKEGLSSTWETAQSFSPFERRRIKTPSFEMIPQTLDSRVRNVGS